MTMDALIVVGGFGLALLSAATAVGNVLVLHAIRTERRLQTVSNMFILSLAVADLTVGLLVMPVSSVYALLGRWALGSSLCKAWLAVDYTASTASILNLVLLSLDRFWAVTAPLHHLRRRTKRQAVRLIAVVWLVSAAWIIPIVGWNLLHRLWDPGTPQPHRSPTPQHAPDDSNSAFASSSSTTTCDTDFANNAAFKVGASLLNFYLPSALMVYLYARIYAAIHARSHPRSMSRQPAPSQCSFRYKSLTLMTSPSLGHQHQIFQGVTVLVECVQTDEEDKMVLPPVGGLSKQRKAARQLGVLVGVFLLCWLPYFSLFPVVTVCDSCVPSLVHTATVWLGYTNSAINPLLYPLCNAHFSAAFRRIVTCRSNTQQDSQGQQLSLLYCSQRRQTKNSSSAARAENNAPL